MWSSYYDILVHHALGNYRDIMREVSASPLMGEYLTFRSNVAYAIGKKYPDENYAREIMQLFSIGLYELFPNGTQKLDPETQTASRTLREGYYPGDLGFDPLGLAPEDPAEFRLMQEKELSHCRLAMIAALGFLLQEAVSGETWGAVYGRPDL